MSFPDFVRGEKIMFEKELKALQVRISERPMKRFSNKVRGDYGNVMEIEKIFKEDLT